MFVAPGWVCRVEIPHYKKGVFSWSGYSNRVEEDVVEGVSLATLGGTINIQYEEAGSSAFLGEELQKNMWDVYISVHGMLYDGDVFCDQSRYSRCIFVDCILHICFVSRQVGGAIGFLYGYGVGALCVGAEVLCEGSAFASVPSTVPLPDSRRDHGGGRGRVLFVLFPSVCLRVGAGVERRRIVPLQQGHRRFR